MCVKVTSGMTLFGIAQQYLGNGNLWHELTVPGWDGNPAHLQIGMCVHLPNEKSGKPAAPPDPFNTKTWTNIPQEYRNQLEDLEHQFQQMTGFRIPISHQQMLEMAQANVLTLYDFGQYMYARMGAELQQNMPWAKYGLSADQFNAAITDYASVFKDLTGSDATPDQLAQALQKRYTGSEWRTYLMQDANMLKTYGWLKYGQTYAQFQEGKQAMVLGLGYMPTDQQALLQLQYSQRAVDSASAAAPPAAPWSKQVEPSEASFATSVAR